MCLRILCRGCLRRLPLGNSPLGCSIVFLPFVVQFFRQAFLTKFEHLIIYLTNINSNALFGTLFALGLRTLSSGAIWGP